MNAIVHGNKLDENKMVIVNAEVEPKRIIWTVTDEGQGFDYNNLADPTAPDKLEELTGRGVFILKHLADQCILTPAATRLNYILKYNARNNIFRRRDQL
jgi:serine/threonine-protein kinase RsbW